jgi:Helix-turn-helix family
MPKLDWPEAPHVQLWNAIILLREYRGDGHIAALTVHGLSCIEALITHVATGTGFDPAFARRLRGWSQQQWDEAVDALRARDLLADADRLTPVNEQVRIKVEDLTDELSYAPWQFVSDG